MSEVTLDLIDRPCPVCRCDHSEVVARGGDYEYQSCSNEFTFVRCRGCETVYLNPRPAVDDFGVIYPDNYYSFVLGRDDADAGRNALVRRAWDVLERQRMKVFFALLGAGERSILDLGCGTGRLLQLLSTHGDPSWSLAGVEFGVPASDILRGSRGNARIYSGFYEDIELDEAPFDLIVAQQVIEHAREPAQMLEKIHAELTPGGHAVIDTPDFDSLDRKLFRRSYWGGYHFPRHLTLFTPRTFTSLAEASGFGVVRWVKMVSPVFWVLSLHNLLVGRGVPPRVAALVHYQSLPLIGAATVADLVNLYASGATSNMRFVLRKPVVGTA